MRVQKKEVPVLEEGDYLVKVVSIESAESKYGEFLRWQFEVIEEGEYQGKMLSGMTPPFLTPNSKLDKWATALGVTSEVGEEIDLDQLLEMKARAIVENKVRGDREYSNVTHLTALKKKKKRVVEEEEDDIPDFKPPKKKSTKSKPKPEPQEEEEEESVDDDFDDDFDDI